MILAGDEASLYLQATLMRVWHATGQTPVVKISPQRHATHFYGALNLLNGQATVMRSPVMNTQTSALFLQQLLTNLSQGATPAPLGPSHLAPRLRRAKYPGG